MQVAWIKWLSERKVLNLILLLIYYLLVVLPHEWVGLQTVKIFGSLTRNQYNLTISALSFIALFIFLLFIFKKVRNSEQELLKWFYFFATILFAILCFKILFVINIEAIHFVQYAGFAVLCFPLFQNFNQTLIISTIAGAIDEAYQYFYLAPQRTNYYDLNDVIINLIGAAFGLILIRCLNPLVKHYKGIRFLKSPAIILSFSVCLVILSSFITSLIGLYATNSDATYVLVKKMPSSFWTEIPTKVLYHIVLPIEGLIITILLLLFYSKICKGCKSIN